MGGVQEGAGGAAGDQRIAVIEPAHPILPLLAYIMVQIASQTQADLNAARQQQGLQTLVALGIAGPRRITKRARPIGLGVEQDHIVTRLQLLIDDMTEGLVLLAIKIGHQREIQPEQPPAIR